MLSRTNLGESSTYLSAEVDLTAGKKSNKALFMKAVNVIKIGSRLASRKTPDEGNST